MSSRPKPSHNISLYSVLRAIEGQGTYTPVFGDVFRVTLPIGEEEKSFLWNFNNQVINEGEESDFQIKLKYGSKGNLQLRLVPGARYKIYDLAWHVRLFKSSGCCGEAFLWRRKTTKKGEKVRQMVAKNILRKGDIENETTLTCKIVFPFINKDNIFIGPLAFSDPLPHVEVEIDQESNVSSGSDPTPNTSSSKLSGGPKKKSHKKSTRGRSSWKSSKSKKTEVYRGKGRMDE